MCNPEQWEHDVTTTKAEKKSKPPLETADADLVAAVAAHEELEVEFAELKERLEGSRQYLLDCFKEQGSPTLVKGDLRAKVQSSFYVNRRPNPPNKALDAVFERVDYEYVKIWHEPSAKKPDKSPKNV